MKFKIIESYTDYGYEKDGIELVSDNSDEIPDKEEKKTKAFFVPYINEFKKYEVTILNKLNDIVWARSPKDAARICRLKNEKDKIKILGIKEI